MNAAPAQCGVTRRKHVVWLVEPHVQCRVRVQRPADRQGRQGSRSTLLYGGAAGGRGGCERVRVRVRARMRTGARVPVA